MQQRKDAEDASPPLEGKLELKSAADRRDEGSEDFLQI